MFCFLLSRFFAFLLVFGYLIMRCLSMVVLFGVHQASWICKFMFYTKFGEITVTIKRYFFPAPIRGSYDMNSRSFDIVPYVTKCLFNLKIFFFSLFIRLDHFYWSNFRFTESFLCHFSPEIETTQQTFKLWDTVFLECSFSRLALFLFLSITQVFFFFKSFY